MNDSVQTILKALDVKELSSAERDEILSDLNDIVFKGTLLRLIEEMNETTRSQFEYMLAIDSSEEEIRTFIQKNLPDAYSAVIDTLAELTGDILAVTKK